jgi:hypothetical protein
MSDTTCINNSPDTSAITGTGKSYKKSN